MKGPRMKTKTHLALWCSCSITCCAVCAETLTICDVPQRLPRDTRLGAYSPPLCFDYAGLRSGETYTLKVWLLTPGLWFCASSQWCERRIAIDNSGGTNSTGRLVFAENMDVYNYSQFDWVLRLYDHAGNEVAFTERFTDATENRAPVLNRIGSQSGVVGQRLEFIVTASDPDGEPVNLAATNLPPDAQF